MEQSPIINPEEILCLSVMDMDWNEDYCSPLGSGKHSKDISLGSEFKATLPPSKKKKNIQEKELSTSSGLLIGVRT